MTEKPIEPVRTDAAGLSVLVADDQISMRDLLKTILRTLRVTNMESVGNGAKAIELYRPTRHDIVFLDIDMPELDGFSVLQQLKEIEPRAFVVMVSAHSDISNIKKALQLGASGFVAKPYTSSKIADMLKKFRDTAR